MILISHPDISVADDLPSVAKSLQVLYTNADQFINKHDPLLAQIARKSPDIIVITEIFPKA